MRLHRALCGSSLFEIPAAHAQAPLPHLGEQGDTRQLIIALDDDTFIVAGTGLTVTFAPHGPGDPIAGIERIEEGPFVDGEWQRGCVLNGDQSHRGRHLRLPPGEAGIQRVTLYRYR